MRDTGRSGPIGDGRYRIYHGSESGHCCFEATVVDTTIQLRDGDNRLIKNSFEIFCECFSIEDAELVARALNAIAMETQRAETENTDSVAKP